MGLESADHINQLNPANPIGGVDKKSQGDDHIRLVKDVLTTDLPNIGGVVTSSHTELNHLTGITGFTGTGTVIAKSAAPAFTGNATAVNLNASGLLQRGGQNVWGPDNDGAASGLDADTVDGQHASAFAAASHAHSAADLTSGTIPDARFPATLPAISGANLTNLDAADLASGSVPDARVPLSAVSQHQASLTTRNIGNKTGVAKTLQNGGSASGGNDGDIIYIY